MPSDLLTSTATTRPHNPGQLPNGINDSVRLLTLLEQINTKIDEIGERVGTKPTHLRLTKTPQLALPLGEWSTTQGANWLQLQSGDGTQLARIPMEVVGQYPDVPKLLARAKMLYDVLSELLELFRMGGTTEANKLSAVFVKNDQPLNPTTVTTFINMLAVVNNTEQ